MRCILAPEPLYSAGRKEGHHLCEPPNMGARRISGASLRRVRKSSSMARSAWTKSQGLQVDVFAFKNDAYLYLVDQAELLTTNSGSIGQLSRVVRPRGVFRTLFNESVSPLTSCRIESHTLQLQPTFSRHERFRIRTRSESCALSPAVQPAAPSPM